MHKFRFLGYYCLRNLSFLQISLGILVTVKFHGYLYGSLKGSFNNYEDRILPFFDPSPPTHGHFLYAEGGQKIFLPPSSSPLERSPCNFCPVSWSAADCPVYFCIFLINQLKLSSLSDWTQNFGQSLFVFWSVSLLESEQKNQRPTKKNQRLTKTFLSGL